MSDEPSPEGLHDIRTTSAPAFEYTPDDHSAIVFIVTLVSGILMLMVLAGKIMLHRKIKSRHVFDFVLVAAASFLFTQTGLTLWAARLGLGKNADQLTDDTIERIRKLQYTSSLLGIAAVAGAKCALNLIIMAVNDLGRMFYASRILLALIILTSFSSLLATGFQCPLGTRWLDVSAATCPNASACYLYTAVANITTDVLLCQLSMAMVWALGNRWQQVLVVALFAPRISCPITLAPSLTNMNFVYSRNYTWLAVSPTIWRQISYNLSIITACIPSMKAVLELFSGNTLTVAIDGPYELGEGTGTGTGTGKSVSQTRSRATDKSARNSRCPTPARFGGRNPILTKDSPAEVLCYSDEPLCRTAESRDQSESVRKLADDFIHIREDVEVQIERLRSLPSNNGSQKIWDGSDHRHHYEIV